MTDPMIGIDAMLRRPIDKATAHAISVLYGNVAHVVILLCARNTCWKAWHTEPRGVARIQAELGYRVLRHAIEVSIDKTVRMLVHDSHA